MAEPSTGGPSDRPFGAERRGGPRPSSSKAPPPSPRSRQPFARVVVLAALGLVVAGFAVLALRQPQGVSRTVASSGEAQIGGPFRLVDAGGRPVDQRVLDGKWSAVFFGYTNCPDTCPATLQALNAAGQQLGAARRDFQVVFISVDPARDTPAQMKLYDSSQGYPAGALVGLTGSPAAVRQAADAYHAIYARQGSGPDYTVQHSAGVYLMDPRGRFVKPLDESQGPAALAGQIRDAMHA